MKSSNQPQPRPPRQFAPLESRAPEQAMMAPQKTEEEDGKEGQEAQPVIQAKWKIAPAHGPAEREADQVAEQLVGKQQAAPAVEAKPEASGPVIQQKAEKDGDAAEVTSDFQEQLKSSAAGSALPPNLNDDWSSKLGKDLSGVRVHNDANAHALSAGIGAKAFTQGQNIHFGAGHYQPNTPGGQQLLAHEVTHTVQQGQSGAAIQRQPDPEVLADITKRFDKEKTEAKAKKEKEKLQKKRDIDVQIDVNEKGNYKGLKANKKGQVKAQRNISRLDKKFKKKSGKFENQQKRLHKKLKKEGLSKKKEKRLQGRDTKQTSKFRQYATEYHQNKDAGIDEYNTQNTALDAGIRDAADDGLEGLMAAEGLDKIHSDVGDAKKKDDKSVDTRVSELMEDKDKKSTLSDEEYKAWVKAKADAEKKKKEEERQTKIDLLQNQMDALSEQLDNMSPIGLEDDAWNANLNKFIALGIEKDKLEAEKFDPIAQSRTVMTEYIAHKKKGEAYPLTTKQAAALIHFMIKPEAEKMTSADTRLVMEFVHCWTAKDFEYAYSAKTGIGRGFRKFMEINNIDLQKVQQLFGWGSDQVDPASYKEKVKDDKLLSKEDLKKFGPDIKEFRDILTGREFPEKEEKQQFKEDKKKAKGHFRKGEEGDYEEDSFAEWKQEHKPRTSVAKGRRAFREERGATKDDKEQGWTHLSGKDRRKKRKKAIRSMRLKHGTAGKHHMRKKARRWAKQDFKADMKGKYGKRKNWKHKLKAWRKENPVVHTAFAAQAELRESYRDSELGEFANLAGHNRMVGNELTRMEEEKKWRQDQSLHSKPNDAEMDAWLAKFEALEGKKDSAPDAQKDAIQAEIDAHMKKRPKSDFYETKRNYHEMLKEKRRQKKAGEITSEEFDAWIAEQSLDRELDLAYEDQPYEDAMRQRQDLGPGQDGISDFADQTQRFDQKEIDLTQPIVGSVGYYGACWRLKNAMDDAKDDPTQQATLLQEFYDSRVAGNDRRSKATLGLDGGTTPSPAQLKEAYEKGHLFRTFPSNYLSSGSPTDPMQPIKDLAVLLLWEETKTYFLEKHDIPEAGKYGGKYAVKVILSNIWDKHKTEVILGGLGVLGLYAWSEWEQFKTDGANALGPLLGLTLSFAKIKDDDAVSHKGQWDFMGNTYGTNLNFGYDFTPLKFKGTGMAGYGQNNAGIRFNPGLLSDDKLKGRPNELPVGLTLGTSTGLGNNMFFDTKTSAYGQWLMQDRTAGDTPTPARVISEMFQGTGPNFGSLFQPGLSMSKFFNYPDMEKQQAYNPTEGLINYQLGTQFTLRNNWFKATTGLDYSHFGANHSGINLGVLNFNAGLETTFGDIFSRNDQLTIGGSYAMEQGLQNIPDNVTNPDTGVTSPVPKQSHVFTGTLKYINPTQGWNLEFQYTDPLTMPFKYSTISFKLGKVIPLNRQAKNGARLNVYVGLDMKPAVAATPIMPELNNIFVLGGGVKLVLGKKEKKK